MAKKLYIYDSTSSLDVAQAACRFGASSDIVTLAISSASQLVTEFEKLVQAGATFDRMLIQTHGNAGMIFFNHVALTADTLLSKFANRGFDALFPVSTRVYFVGCTVASGDEGKRFMTVAGGIFLKRSGGEVFAFTSLGTAIPWWVPFIAGHTVHFNDGFVKIFFSPGGSVFDPPYVEPVWDNRWKGKMQ